MRKQKSNIKWSLAAVWILLVVGLVFICFYADMGHKNVVINEVCAYNDGIIYDTAGFYHDYIELYNPTEELKDISGFYLSDDKDNLKKYAFPENTLMVSGEYFLLWAGVWSEDSWQEDERYYTGFSLRAGETLYLSDSQGEVIDKVKIPSEALGGVAYSRVSVSNDVWKMTEGSPGDENDITVEEEKYLKAEVAFSAEAGFYEEPFYLEMSTNKSYDIYYTLDGSVPTTESLKYEGPILIEDASNNENKYASIADITLRENMYIPVEKVTKATTIRAVAVDKQGRMSEESHATYFVDFENKSGFENIPIVSLITDPENLFGYETGIYVIGNIGDINAEAGDGSANYMCKGTGWKKQTTLQYFDASGNLIYDQQIGLGIHGKSSASYNQKSLNLTALPQVDGNKYVCEGMFGRNETTLMLRSGGGELYRTKLRDVLTQELVKDRWLTVSDFQPCQVFLDGEYWGLYMLQERVGESLVSSLYDIPEENIIVTKVEEVVAGEETDIELWEEVMTFARENDLSIPENYQQMEQMIDIQSCIDHYAFEIYIANSDSLRNNQARWRVRETGDGLYEDGKWRWFIYDVDSSLGHIPGLNSEEIDTFTSGNFWYSALQDELFCALVWNDEFKYRFVTSFMDMANYNFESGKVLARIDELEKELTEAMTASNQRFYSPDYSAQEYAQELNVIKTFFAERYDYITAHLKTDFGLVGELVPVTVENTDGGRIYFNTLTFEEGETFTGKYYSDYEIVISAEPSKGYECKGWLVNDEYYAQAELELYLRSDNEYIMIPIWEKIQ